jgi:arylsulfatase A-like enzyme
VLAEENYYQDKVCIRTKENKLIKSTGRNVCELCNVRHGEDVELYDLEADPNELHNIAALQGKKIAILEEKIQWRYKTKTQYSTQVRTHEV